MRARFPPTRRGSAAHACAIANSDGSVSIFYFRQTPGAPPGAASDGIYTATSTDGLTFSSETATGISRGNDPDVVQAGGSLRMYYNWFDAGSGSNGTIYAARRTGNAFAPMFVPQSAETPLVGPFAPFATGGTPKAGPGLRPRPSDSERIRKEREPPQ